ncbi:Crp/Fnr family transcriptional regulator [Miniphocaeibacter massiliensis]|uniref:Crp/Fnr family transcriptional regulator n=1 Tax=Miniphocaeibacter massiliensis TaxID=2041841 RepID=UPI0013EA76C5|nr:Crp/Fnr family transcriptional regulator [Miniphocaeibacter massiliensis]
MRECDNLNYEKLLEEIPFFDGLSKDEKNIIFEGVKFFEVKNGDIIFETGDSASRLYIIVEGRIKIYNNLLDGREQILYIYSPGDFVGGLNILQDDEYRYIGKALEEGIIVTLSKEKFEEIALNNPITLRRILEKSDERIRWAEGLVKRLFAGTADGKVASLLLDLADIFGTRTVDGVLLAFPISREEMASFAGTSRETITRKLHQFKEKGYIDILGNKKILIYNMEVLEDLAGEY